MLKKAEYILIGRIIEKKHPDLLANLMPMVKPGLKRVNQDDLDNIVNIYDWYQANLPGTPAEKETISMKETIFCALIMKIYCPDIFSNLVKVKMRDNLRLSLALVLGKNDHSRISHLCSSVTTYMKAYQAFRDSLDYFYDTYQNKQADGS